MTKSASVKLKVHSKLTKVQEDVKSSFDLLYTSRRHLLLPKAMELERCDSVKDQLHSLEIRVVALLKAYNSLQNKRREKDQLLAHLLQEQESLRPSEIPEIQTNIATADVDRKYAQALRLLDHESDYTSILDHMIIEGTKAITSRVQPIYHLRKELQQLKIRFHETEVDSLRISLEQKSIRNSIRRSEETFDQQKSHHTHRVQEKVTEFRRRKEFEEFIGRQKEQRTMQDRIRENETEAKEIENVRKAAESAENFIDSSKSHLEALSEYEKQTEKLSRAAHTSSIQQVLDYWTYLQEFGGSLQSQVKSGTQRVSTLRDQLENLRKERTTVKLQLEPTEVLTNSQLAKLRSALETKEEQVEAMAAGVRLMSAGRVAEGGGQC